MTSATIGATLLSNLYERVEEQIAEHKQWYFLQALTCMVAGGGAVALSATTALAIEHIVGITLIAVGVVKAITGLKSHMHWWSLVSAAVAVGAGALVLWQPVSGVLTLATVIAVFLFVDGLSEIFLAFEFESAPNWGWLSLAGLVSVILSAVLFFGWSGMTLSLFGIMVGASLFAYGAALLALSAAIPRFETL